MDELVELKRNEAFCDSQTVARKFELKHAYVVRAIKNLKLQLEKIRVTSNHPKVITEEREYRGLKYTAHLMNREFFSLLSMRFKGQKAFEWQVKFNSAFYDLEKIAIIEATNKKNEAWLASRQQGKIVHRETTDVIKDFVDYATNQGSTHAKMYYKHITNLTYKALGLVVQRKPKLRDTLSIFYLCNIATAEFIAQRSIKKYMDDGIPYKKVYDFVKEDLEKFADSIKIGDIEKRIR